MVVIRSGDCSVMAIWGPGAVYSATLISYNDPILWDGNSPMQIAWWIKSGV